MNQIKTFQNISKWYKHCLNCGHYFKLPKATYFASTKLKPINKIHCPRCNSLLIESTSKQFYEKFKKMGIN